jgi:hypothetical protein
MDNRKTQYQYDAAELDRVLRKYQTPEGHCEIAVKIQNGFISLIETTHKSKPQKANGDT